jgi:peptide/nickel transport system substrate-binding protein
MKKGLSFLMTTLLLMTLWAFGVFAAAKTVEAPKYGGTLTLFESYPAIAPMSWDNADWVWKHAYDTGFYMEHLLMGDLQKGPRGTNQYNFEENSWFPPEVVRGELVQKWEIRKKPPQVIFHLRKGVMWQEKPGVMKTREFVAEDVVYSMERLKNARRAIPDHLSFIDRWEIIDKNTLIMHMKEWNADWQYRMGWGANTAVQAPEQEKAPGRSGQMAKRLRHRSVHAHRV